VFVTHGSVAVLVRWLCEQGLEAQSFHTEYGDEDDQDPAAPGAVPGQPSAADATDGANAAANPAANPAAIAAPGGDASPVIEAAAPEGHDIPPHPLP